MAVARLIPNFEYRPAAQGGSFKKWLLNQTKWRIGDHFRAHQRQRMLVPLPVWSEAGSEELGEIPDPVGSRLDELWEAEWEKNLEDAAVEHVRSRVDPKHYQIFFLRMIKGWPVLKVARHLQVGLPQVYTVAHRITKQVRQRLKELRKNEH